MQFWRHKNKMVHMNKILTILSFNVLLIVISHSSHASQQVTVQGKFPSFTTTNNIILKPRSTAPGRCEDGTIFVDSVSGDLKTCHGTTVANSVWTKSGSSIAPADTTPGTLQFIIGGNVPPAAPGASDHLTLIGLNPQGIANKILLQTSNALGNSGIVLATQGNLSATPRNDHAYYDFMVGSLVPGNGRIEYQNIFSSRKGFNFIPDKNASTNNVWIDAVSHNIGIGTLTPTEQLEIFNGNIETNSLYLKADGSHEGILHVSYDAAGSGGYYAVYAP